MGKWNSLDNEFPVALGHTRLAILDLTGAGNQPLLTEDNRFVFVYNGEIYNFIELRSELESLGHVFKTKTDTEVFLKGLILEGPSFQLRNNNNSNIRDNIVFKKGTPRKLRNLNGIVLSLLTGGGGNNNYWHWLYDVLPRLELCEKSLDLELVDYFLLPNPASRGSGRK